MEKKTIEQLLIELYDDKIINAGQYYLLTEAVKDKVQQVRKELEYLQSKDKSDERLIYLLGKRQLRMMDSPRQY